MRKALIDEEKRLKWEEGKGEIGGRRGELCTCPILFFPSLKVGRCKKRYSLYPPPLHPFFLYTVCDLTEKGLVQFSSSLDSS